MILGVHHIALATLDIARLAAFYCDAFGFRVVKKGSWSTDSRRHELVTGMKATAATTWMLAGPNLFLELFQYRTPLGARVPRRLPDPGLSHFCLAVRDIDAEFDRLVGLGMTFANAPPGDTADPTRALYGQDIDGNIIELLEHHPSEAHPYHAALLGLGTDRFPLLS